MNLYMLVEGARTEKLVYGAWLAHTQPALTEVARPEDLVADNFFLISGGGYPSYLDRIRSSLEDIRDNVSVSHFFVCIDSEEQSYEEKLAEVVGEIGAAETETGVIAAHRGLQVHVIVQHCCIETWFLGNEKMMPAQPTAEPLKRYASFFDVRTADPETMGCPPGHQWRAQFHLEYLRHMIRSRGDHLSYSKHSPGPVLERAYYQALEARAQKGHLASFSVLAKVLRGLGG